MSEGDSLRCLVIGNCEISRRIFIRNSKCEGRKGSAMITSAICSSAGVIGVIAKHSFRIGRSRSRLMCLFSSREDHDPTVRLWNVWMHCCRNPTVWLTCHVPALFKIRHFFIFLFLEYLGYFLKLKCNFIFDFLIQTIVFYRMQQKKCRLMLSFFICRPAHFLFFIFFLEHLGYFLIPAAGYDIILIILIQAIEFYKIQ